MTRGSGWKALVVFTGMVASYGCACGRPSASVGGAGLVGVASAPPPLIASGESRTPEAPSPAGSASGATPVAKKYTRPSKAELKQRLTAEQYEVTQEEGTERPFHNEYWNNHEAGLYVDVTTGEPLFSSTDKFESGTGWPSFTRPVGQDHVRKRSDESLGMSRDEVRSSVGDAHLGHVFDDGPRPTGLRYCINSASLRFIPVAKLEAEGYGDYVSLFSK